MAKSKTTLTKIFTKFSVVIGVVLIWRGMWYGLDALDAWLFGTSHILTAVGSVVVGVAVLYLSDPDLKQL